MAFPPELFWLAGAFIMLMAFILAAAAERPALPLRPHAAATAFAMLG
jgi:hypothetical protein